MNRIVQRSDWRWRLDCQLTMLKESLAGSRSILDVGCGNGGPLAELSGFRMFGVDGYWPSVAAARDTGRYERVECADLLEYLDSVKQGSFDAVVALDVVEHFGRADGSKLLHLMEQAASRIAIVCTPNGFLAQPATENPCQEHLSGWSASDFSIRGYEVFGLYGAKAFRGAGHELRISGSSAFAQLSWWSQSLVKSRPALAAALFCKKMIRAE